MTYTTPASVDTDDTEDLFTEHDTSATDADRPIRQGDVLEFLHCKDEFPLDDEKTLGVVVTANCDLAYGKNWNLITYVPAVPVDSYVKQFVIPKEITSQLSQTERAIQRLFRNSSTSDQLDRAFEMLRLGYSAEEISVLLPPNSREKNDLIAGIRVLQALQTSLRELALCSHPGPFCRCLLAHCRRLDKARPAKKSADELLRANVRERLKRFPGDALYVHKPSPHHGTGYVALLRLVTSIHESAVSAKPINESPATEARRVAQLNTLFCHRIVQQMAQVFTDIGLPEDYETAREIQLTKISESWEY
ncbi:hypothetical protein [Streptomyces sp. NPDC057257]|uniref:hypothetical protein n=1 Tax=Streptomyces sp. NPDC057257 TaxID=3346071 RepID=UPI00363B14FA